MEQSRYQQIIGRVEDVRRQLGLNKSQFASRFGMKPQTYNNFVGSQGSKPNIALILGITQTFNVNPDWLLKGTGEVFKEGTELPEVMEEPAEEFEAALEGHEGRHVDEIAALRKDLELVLVPYRKKATPLLYHGAARNPQIGYAIQVLTHLFYVAPVETSARVVSMLNDFRRITRELEQVARRRGQHKRHA